MMIDIATHSNGMPVSLKDIANRQDISNKYLEQISSLLMKRGLIKSVRGNNGGYLINKDYSSITIKDILSCTEISLAPVECLNDHCNSCPRANDCPSLEIWEGLYQRTDEYLSSITLSSILEKQINKNWSDYTI